MGLSQKYFSSGAHGRKRWNLAASSLQGNTIILPRALAVVRLEETQPEFGNTLKFYGKTFHQLGDITNIKNIKMTYFHVLGSNPSWHLICDPGNRILKRAHTFCNNFLHLSTILVVQ